MPQSRRRLLTILLGATGVLAAKPLSLSGFPAQHSTPQPIPSPNAPDQNFPPGLNGPDNKLPGNKPVDPRMQQQFRADVQKLFDLASELRDETQKSDLNSTLPISLVKKAQQIEKLARQIKDLAKG